MEENIIWTEKFRPQNLKDIQGQKSIVSKLEKFLEHRNMPHLLFSGPAGVGKSTLALVIAKELYKDSWKQNFLELNASDERGIDIVRTKIKDFAKIKTLDDIPFKIIFLDEADALTKDAQQALRRTMEVFTENTRFILSCNYSSKIIDPIQSRCAVFRFKPLEKQNIIELANMIEKNENLQISEDAKNALSIICNGDARKLVNTLQSISYLKKNINAEDIFEMASFASPQEIKEFLKFAIDKHFAIARKKLMDIIIKYGLSGTDIIRNIVREIQILEIEDSKKLEMIRICADVEFRLVEGSNDIVQLDYMIASFGLL
ncbi:MAG: replication factor C small subunit [Candidatus Nanoarchaeia archaeon]|nr:replication factor C small subunit [Candidatus Nanoarchaeia archaeon]